MQWTSAVSQHAALTAAVQETADTVESALGGEPPDLLVVFASEQHQADYDRVPELLRGRFPSGVLIGCSAGGVIGGGHEVERRPGLSLTAARLPGVALHPFHVETEAVPPPLAPDAHVLLLPDPFTFDADGFVRRLDEAVPGTKKVGGLASGGREPGGNALYLGDRTYRGGLVGVALSGNLEIDTIVAQGCRPIGEPMFVTGCEENLLRTLDGRPAVQTLQELYRRAGAKDRELFRHSLFIGIVMDEARHSYAQGDFLVRNILGIDAPSGAIAIGAPLHPGMVVQFHLRDRRTSAEDLETLLGQYRAAAQGAPPAGALLFSCLGRGLHLYGAPDHDTDALRRHLGDLPLGGFFCNGEIGPVQGTTFLHGYTSAFALFRPRTPGRASVRTAATFGSPIRRPTTSTESPKGRLT